MKSKKAVSVIVGYVLLIVLMMSMALVTYSWLKRQTPQPEKICPDSVSITITKSYCQVNHILNLSLQNNGLFTISGIIIKMSNQSNKIPIYGMKLESPENIDRPISNISDQQYLFSLNASGVEGNTINLLFDYSQHVPEQGTIKLQIIPMYNDAKQQILCSNQKIEQEINNCI